MAMHMTESNYFINLNKQWFGMEGETLTVDYAHLTLSEGGVAPVGFGEPVTETVGETVRVTVRFEPNPLHVPACADDKVYLCALCAECSEALLSLPVCRRHGTVTLELPARWQDCTVHLYGFVQDYTGDASQSLYLGTTGNDDRQQKKALSAAEHHNEA